MTKRTSKARSTLKKRKTPKKRPGPKVTKKGLRWRLDQAFSWYIRLTHADEDGNCKCFTCDKVLHWSKIQNGHFISRRRLKTRWRPDNCRPQCYGCNIASSGMQWLFGKYLDEYYGKGHAEAMYRLSLQTYEPTKQQYEDYIEYYQGHVAAILARRIERDSAERARIPKEALQGLRLHQ